jgi:hypothetical protein
MFIYYSHCLIIGFFILGILTQARHFYSLIVRREQPMQNMMTLCIVWIGNDLFYSLKLFSLIGLLICAKEYHEYFSEKVRFYSQTLGNEILEIEEDELPEN